MGIVSGNPGPTGVESPMIDHSGSTTRDPAGTRDLSDQHYRSRVTTVYPRDTDTGPPRLISDPPRERRNIYRFSWGTSVPPVSKSSKTNKQTFDLSVFPPLFPSPSKLSLFSFPVFDFTSFFPLFTGPDLPPIGQTGVL